MLRGARYAARDTVWVFAIARCGRLGMKKLRVLVVEDSATMRAHLCDALRSDPELEVVAEAEDGKRAIDLCQALRPDVMTLDMMLPVMSGVAATEYIMAHFPTPILIVSASTQRGELFRTYDALAAGAVDVLEKPTGHEPEGVWERKLAAAVKMVARIKVITHPRGRLNRGPNPRLDSLPAPSAAATGTRQYSLVALGASTGGPGALVEVLSALPAGLPWPVLIVLHIGELFGAAFAEWLAGLVQHPVAYARGGEQLSAAKGCVFMAPPNRHMVVSRGRLLLNDEPPRHFCCPSVDCLFESLAREQAASTIGCLLTGMGRDGAAGLLELRRAGGLTFAQDEASCVVYGMPREAALLGAAEQVLPLTEIGPRLAALARRSSEARK